MGDPVTTGLMVGMSLLSASQQYGAGQQFKAEADIQAKSEEVGAIQREADRKADLARAMASQTASAGARGIAAFEGSPLAVLQEDIRREEVATERDLFNSKMSQMTIKARGKAKAKQATIGAFTTLIGAGLKTASLMTPAQAPTSTVSPGSPFSQPHALKGMAPVGF